MIFWLPALCFFFGKESYAKIIGGLFTFALNSNQRIYMPRKSQNLIPVRIKSQYLSDELIPPLECHTQAFIASYRLKIPVESLMEMIRMTGSYKVYKINPILGLLETTVTLSNSNHGVIND